MTSTKCRLAASALVVALFSALMPLSATVTAAASVTLPVGKTYSSAPPVPVPGTCHARGVFPDPKCTPGATNPAVTQVDIGATICKSGWSESVRPPESYTEPLKRRLMASYGATYPIAEYELDHLVSLEPGGAPSDPRNLWPEFGASPNPKDRVEDAAHEAVCDHRLSLAAAQFDIAANWVALGEQLGLGDLAGEVPKPGGSSTSAPPTTAPSSSGGVSNKSASGHYYKPGEYCPHRDLGKTITDPYGTMVCKEPAGGGQPVWERTRTTIAPTTTRKPPTATSPPVHVTLHIVGTWPDNVTGKNPVGGWILWSNGRVVNLQGAPNYGGATGAGLNDFVGLIEDVPLNGYWLVTSTGKIFAFGQACPSSGLVGPKRRPTAGIVGAVNLRDTTIEGFYLVSATGASYEFVNPYSE